MDVTELQSPQQGNGMSRETEILDLRIPDGGATDLNPQLRKTGAETARALSLLFKGRVSVSFTFET